MTVTTSASHLSAHVLIQRTHQNHIFHWPPHVKRLTSFNEVKTQWLLVAFTQAYLPNLPPCLSSAWPPYKQADSHLHTLDLRLSRPMTAPPLDCR